MDSNITVSGNIVGELSEKIPSNIIALNELIKNSYDAGAKNIVINLDTINKKLIVSDNGIGMDKDDINTLFHIASSKKKYGKVNEFGRRTQGSKGLGFLSVFKFGGFVTWRTNKNQGYKFTANYNQIVNSEDVYKYKIEIVEDESIKKGTEIEIDLDDYNIKSLKMYFSEESKYEKILNSFLDEDITIKLIIDGDELPSMRKNINEYLPERQLYYIKYSSAHQKLQFYYNSILIMQYDYDFNSTEYELEIELQIFQFKNGDKENGKKKINKLFYNPQKDLTPLIYINSNLFNNYNIFDPGIMKNIKSGMTLNQMIGYIKIVSDDTRINFNSDRTQFLQNEVTDGIIEFLRNINKFIQKEGAKYRKHLVELDFLNGDFITYNGNEYEFEVKCKDLIKDTFKFKDKVIIQKKSERVEFSIFGRKKEIPIKMDKKKEKTSSDLNKENGLENNNKSDNNKSEKTQKIVPAKLILKEKLVKVEIPSEQIDLIKYIDLATDSKGCQIDIENIEINVDNKKTKNNILQSINIPCNKKIEYIYLDPITGIVNKSMIINFYQDKKNINFEGMGNGLVFIPARSDYTISFNYVIGKLIDQINSLNLKKYREIISCSLRSLFEMSIDSLIKSQKFKDIFKNIKKLEERVEKVIKFVSSNKQYMSTISNHTNIDYNSLKNRLDASDFKLAIEKANLGAHKSNTYMSDLDIEHLAKMSAIFIVIINELITNEDII